MSHGVFANPRRAAAHRRAALECRVETLEGRVLLSGATTQQSTAPVAQVDAVSGQRATTTVLQASTQTIGSREAVTLVATIRTAGTDHLVRNGRVRFTLESPTPEVLGSAYVNKLAEARLRTLRLIQGGTYQVEAEYLPPTHLYASSKDQIEINVVPPPVTSFLITAPHFYGAPGTPLTFSVTAIGRDGQPATNFTGTIDLFSPTDHSATLIDRSYTFTTADQGTHQFPDGITFHKGGAEVLKVDQTNNTKIGGKATFGLE